MSVCDMAYTHDGEVDVEKLRRLSAQGKEALISALREELTAETDRLRRMVEARRDLESHTGNTESTLSAAAGARRDADSRRTPAVDVARRRYAAASEALRAEFDWADDVRWNLVMLAAQGIVEEMVNRGQQCVGRLERGLADEVTVRDRVRDTLHSAGIRTIDVPAAAIWKSLAEITAATRKYRTEENRIHG